MAYDLYREDGPEVRRQKKMNKTIASGIKAGAKVAKKIAKPIMETVKPSAKIMGKAASVGPKVIGGLVNARKKQKEALGQTEEPRLGAKRQPAGEAAAAESTVPEPEMMASHGNDPDTGIQETATAPPPQAADAGPQAAQEKPEFDRVDYSDDKYGANRKVTDKDGNSVTLHGGGKLTLDRARIGVRIKPGSKRGRSSLKPPSTGTPTGPRGAGARRSSIKPPTSIGDLVRYNRERKALREDLAAGEASARTNTAADNAATNQRKQTYAEKQQELENQQTAEDRANAAEDRAITAEDRARTKALSDEYADPNTTPERKLSIERQMAVMSGKQPTRPGNKNLQLTEKQRVDTQMKLQKEYEERSGKAFFKRNRKDYNTWLKETYPHLVNDFSIPDETSVPSTPVNVTSPEQYNRLKPGDRYIDSKGNPGIKG